MSDLTQSIRYEMANFYLQTLCLIWEPDGNRAMELGDVSHRYCTIMCIFCRFACRIRTIITLSSVVHAECAICDGFVSLWLKMNSLFRQIPKRNERLRRWDCHQALKKSMTDVRLCLILSRTQQRASILFRADALKTMDWTTSGDFERHHRSSWRPIQDDIRQEFISGLFEGDESNLSASSQRKESGL
jgi:hypothetical protein